MRHRPYGIISRGRGWYDAQEARKAWYDAQPKLCGEIVSWGEYWEYECTKKVPQSVLDRMDSNKVRS